MNEERRASPRFSVKQFIDISYGDEKYINVQALDLSQGGFACQASVPLEPLTPIYVLLELHRDSGQKETFEVDAYIAHSRMENGKCIAGVCFTNRNPGLSEVIEEVIAGAAKKVE